MEKKNIVHECLLPYQTDHKCDQKLNFLLSCRICKKNYKTLDGFDNHECKFWKCEKCHKTYKEPTNGNKIGYNIRSKKDHICKEWFCRNCKEWILPNIKSEHNCYMKREEILKKFHINNFCN